MLRRRWVWALVPLLLVPAAIAGLTATRPEVYVASSSVLLEATAAQEAVDDTATNTGILDRSLENEICLALSDTARQQVASRLGVAVDDLPKTDVTRDGRADVLTFTVRERTPDAAADAANVWAETFVELKQTEAEQSITGAVDRLTARLDDAQVRRAAADDDSERAVIDAQISSITDSIIALELSGELALSGTARVIVVANPPQSRSNAPVGRNVVLALVAGALLGVGAALAAEGLDRSIRQESDLERMGQINLGSVPSTGPGEAAGPIELLTLREPDSPFADAYQKVLPATAARTPILGLAGTHSPLRDEIDTHRIGAMADWDIPGSVLDCALALRSRARAGGDVRDAMANRATEQSSRAALDRAEQILQALVDGSPSAVRPTGRAGSVTGTVRETVSAR